MKVVLFVLFVFFGLYSSVFAQETSDEFVQKYGITFPIAELGNCNNVATCKVYCDHVKNHESCIAFAKSKGLYQETINQKQVTAVSSAKVELGCDSVNSCKTLCQQKVNQAKCQSIAQKHGLSTPPTSTSKDEELLVRAKQNLNCDSFESCKVLCDQQDNYTKCTALLQDQVTSDDRAMFEKYKPQIKEFLGCDSIVTCMAFCINPVNMPKCAELGSKIGSSEVPNQEPPEVWCPNISSECKWDGTNCICNGPQTCSQSNDIPGCTWDGTQCNCPGSGSPTQTEGTQPTQEPGEVWCPRNPGCNWTGTECQCTSVEAPQTVEQTPAPVVQGITTNRGLLQQILDFILRR